MTVIIGFVDKKNKRTFMGCDRCCSNSLQKFSIGSSKIYQPAENPNFLFGFAGDPRVKQLISSILYLPTEKQIEADNIVINEAYFVRSIIPSIQKILIDHNYHDANLEGSQMLIAYKDNIWALQYGFQLISIEDNYMSIGSGCYAANGAFEALRPNKIDPLTKMAKVLKIATKLSNGVEGPYDLFLTGSGKLDDQTLQEIIDERDEEPIVVSTVNNKYIKKVIKTGCNVGSLTNSEEIVYITKDNSSVIFLDYDGNFGKLKANGDVILNPYDDLEDLSQNIWSLVSVTNKAKAAIEMSGLFKMTNEKPVEEESCDNDKCECDGNCLTCKCKSKEIEELEPAEEDLDI